MLLGCSSSFMKKTPSSGLRVEFIVSHSIEDTDLVYWKAEEISRLFDTNVIVRDDHNKVGFSVTKGKRIRVIHTWFHRKGRKAITDKIRFMDHPVGMAMLLCDKGTVTKHKHGTDFFSEPSIAIAVPYFPENEVLRLLNHIKTLCRADGYIVSENDCQQVYFDPENSKTLWHYASPWIPEVSSVIRKFSFFAENRTGT